MVMDAMKEAQMKIDWFSMNFTAFEAWHREAKTQYQAYRDALEFDPDDDDGTAMCIRNYWSPFWDFFAEVGFPVRDDDGQGA
jgi:hypothetical protein